MENEEIEKQIATIKSMLKGITENKAIKGSVMYQQLLDKYLDELNELLKKLEK